MSDLPPYSARILVIGDIIIDEYVYGEINRMSPEDSSVPVLDFSNHEYRLGGAGNVAANIKSLYPEADVTLAGIASYFTITNLINPKGINNLIENNIYSKKRPAMYDEIVKTRVFDKKTNKQLIRIDNLKSYPSNEVSIFLEDLQYHDLNKFDVIVVSDYKKGSINESVVKMLESYCGPIFIDTKKRDLSIWNNLKQHCIKINDSEFRQYGEFVCWGGDPTITGVLVVTKGKDGCEIHAKDGVVYTICSEMQVSNPDVCGAGDTFLAGLVVKYMTTFDFKEACKFANKVAGISVTKPGTTVVTKRDLDAI